MEEGVGSQGLDGAVWGCVGVTLWHFVKVADVRAAKGVKALEKENN